jgi:hypothetical protein
MKYLSIYLVIILLIGVEGCNFLNYDESSYFTRHTIYSQPGGTNNFLDNIYAQLPSGFNSVGGAMRASATDNAVEINSSSSVYKFIDGSWSAKNTVDAEWGHDYGLVQAANDFLANFNIKNFENRKYNDDYPQIIQEARIEPAQARFLRALAYFRLIKRYGHVPLITKTLTPEEANNVKPSTYQAVTDFIVSECDTIVPKLPIDYHFFPRGQTGRATRGAAMALKAKALLYAASPLHNSSGDVSKWKDAARAAKAVINSGWYSLDNNYTDIVNNTTSSGLIFGIRHEASNSFEAANFPIGYTGAQDKGTAPTQNLVDAYEMQKTGLPITNSSSGYEPQHPYKGRDPRLEETIIVNNSSWKDRKVQIWNGGEDGPPKTGATPTGYYLKKYVRESTSFASSHTTTRKHTWVVFRYGGILLDYAEAKNEAYGPYDDPTGTGETAQWAVNKIRKRAGMPVFPTGLSKSAFRKKLHNERRVEMAFENQRFWDIRRWKIGPSTTDIKGMKITKNSDGSFTYKEVTVENRLWDEKMYFYPIPENEIFINKDLQQNPEW